MSLDVRDIQSEPYIRGKSKITKRKDNTVITHYVDVNKSLAD